jgi:hypothetical protein
VELVVESAGELIDNEIGKQGESRTKPAAAVDGERRDDSVGFIHEEDGDNGMPPRKGVGLLDASNK